MYTLRILIFLFGMIFCTCVSTYAAEMYGQVLFTDGSPVAYTDVLVNDNVTTTTNQSGYYSIQQLNPGEYTVSVKGKSKSIFLSPRNTRVDFRIAK